jgi:hypothetical protein
MTGQREGAADGALEVGVLALMIEGVDESRRERCGVAARAEAKEAVMRRQRGARRNSGGGPANLVVAAERCRSEGVSGN